MLIMRILFSLHRTARRLVAAALVLSTPVPAADVIELQAQRQSTLGRTGVGSQAPAVVLTDLNPLVHAWYVLDIRRPDGAYLRYHLQLPEPATQRLVLDSADGARLLITDPRGDTACVLQGESALTAAAQRPLPYVPLCGGKLYLRRQLAGAETALESAVEFVRTRVWSGEQLVNVVKEHLQERARDTVELNANRADAVSAEIGPRPALVSDEYDTAELGVGRLGIQVDEPQPQALRVGHWYPALRHTGVYVSIIEPAAVAPLLQTSYSARVNPLGAAERRALVYLVAFDLSQFDLAFAMGTGHPRVGWSARAQAAVRGRGQPGPDGFDTLAPLAMTGMVPPWATQITAATFVGGFKRDHGAFKYGALGQRNRGSHYGFVEDGVVLSSLQPGLATVYVLLDGSVRFDTWQEHDSRKLPLVRYARQNGVPLIERESEGGAPVPGSLVNDWGRGNWSGSADSSLRAVRAGLCRQESARGTWLIYAYFSSATPSAMARVFQAYDCAYAMVLDMNALVHTYLAVYDHKQDAVEVEHVVADMLEADPEMGAERVPRFLTTPDNRDFFYLTRRRVSRAP